jgi:hypothetical protein
MISHLHKVQISLWVKANLVGLIQRGLGCGSPIARVALPTISGEDAHLLGFQVEPPESMVPDLGDVECSIRADFHAEGPTQIDFRRLSRITICFSFSRAGHRGHDPFVPPIRCPRVILGLRYKGSHEVTD